MPVARLACPDISASHDDAGADASATPPGSAIAVSARQRGGASSVVAKAVVAMLCTGLATGWQAAQADVDIPVGNWGSSRVGEQSDAVTAARGSTAAATGPVLMSQYQPGSTAAATSGVPSAATAPVASPGLPASTPLASPQRSGGTAPAPSAGASAAGRASANGAGTGTGTGTRGSMRAPANPSGGPAGPMAGRPAVLPQPSSTPLPAIPQPQPVAPASAAPSQSLLELFDAARAYDATYLATSAVAESAIYRARQADALNLPAASVGAAVSHTEVDVPIYGRLSSNNQQFTLQGRQSLFNLTNRATIEQAYRNLDLARADLDVAEQDLIVRVAQAYFDVLAAQDAVATNLANKTAITEQLAAARRNFEVGTATITDTREAQARFDLATAQQIASDNDLINRRIALDTLVGMKGVNPRQIAAPLALPPLAPSGVESWASIALNNHPSIRRAQLGLDIARLEVDKSRAALYPTVDLVGSAGPSRSTGGAVALSGLPGTTSSASVGVQLNMTLFSGFSQQNRIRETLLLQDRSVQDLESARRGVDQATRQTYYSLQSGRAQVTALEAAESSSQLALEATQTGYRVGVRVNLDVLNSQTQLYTTQQNLASARYNLLLGSLRLRQASGTLSAGDVQSINNLLAP